MATEQDILVLREMVRLAENRRAESLESLERINKHNLAIIAFSASVLSLLVTAQFPVLIVRLSGFFLLLSIGSSLFAISPRRLRGVTLLLDDDVIALRNSRKIALDAYLLDVSDLTNKAASKITALVFIKKRFTIFSAVFLVVSLLLTYTLYAYA